MATTVFDRPTVYNDATQSASGLMSAADKTKLDGVATGATANTGDVVGPSSSTGGNVAVFDGASGKAIKDSGYTIGKSVPSDAVFTDHYAWADITGKPTIWYSGNNNWWEAPVKQPAAYKYEGQNTTTYKLPIANCIVYVLKESNARGVAFAIRWSSAANQMWIARLHDDTSPYEWSAWTEVLTTEKVIDNLTSTSTTDALSAKQGKVLNDGKVNKSGDTMTGDLTIQKASATPVIYLKRSDTGLHVSMRTGDSNHGIYSNGYYDGTTFHSDAKWLVYRGSNGTVYFDGKTLGTSVPSDAKFTDTTYSNATTSAAGLMSSTDKTRLDTIVATNTLYTGSNLGTAKNGAALNTTDYYSRAVKCHGIVQLFIRITCPTMTATTVIFTLASALQPAMTGVTGYIPCWEMWNQASRSYVTINQNGNISVQKEMSGKDIMFMVTYPAGSI